MSTFRFFRRVLSLPVVAAAVLAAALPLSAQNPIPPEQTVTREHNVRPGDTLWDLAAFYYGNPFLWPLIYDANKPVVVEDPHWIFPKEKLIIPGRTAASAALTPLGRPVDVPLEVAVTPLMPDTAPTPTPSAPGVTETIDLRRPFVTAAEHTTAPWLSLAPEASIIGRLVRVTDPTVGSGKIPQSLYPHDRVLIGDLKVELAKGDSVNVQVVFGVEQAGNYVFRALLEALVDSSVLTTPVRILKGDVNGDLAIDVADAVRALQGIVGAAALSDAEQFKADVNGDGITDVTDVVMLLRWAVGIQQSLEFNSVSQNGNS